MSSVWLVIVNTILNCFIILFDNYESIHFYAVDKLEVPNIFILLDLIKLTFLLTSYSYTDK